MRRISWLWLVAAASLLVGAELYLIPGGGPERGDATPAAADAKPIATGPTPPLPPTPATAAARLPSFDVVTVSPQGQAVVAGRAAPGDHIRVLDAGKTLGEVTADERGEWVLAPADAIAPGEHQIAAEAAVPGGGPVRRSSGVVALSVMPRSDGVTAPTLAAVVPEDANEPARLLDTPASNAGLALDTARIGAEDRLALTGRADPGARLNVYAGDRLLGSVTADTRGRWTLATPHGRLPRAFELRLDQLAADGTVMRRVAAPFAPPAVAAANDANYIVRQGNSLWVIARQIYGDGVRYTAIYAANRDQIRDPDVIYPGQHFRLPRS